MKVQLLLTMPFHFKEIGGKNKGSHLISMRCCLESTVNSHNRLQINLIAVNKENLKSDLELKGLKSVNFFLLTLSNQTIIFKVFFRYHSSYFAIKEASTANLHLEKLFAVRNPPKSFSILNILCHFNLYSSVWCFCTLSCDA